MRKEHLPFTNKLIERLNDCPPLIEHEDSLNEELDNVFINLRDSDYTSGFYLQIELEAKSEYSISLRERGHSGGDPTLGETMFFSAEKEDEFIVRALDIFNSAPTF